MKTFRLLSCFFSSILLLALITGCASNQPSSAGWRTIYNKGSNLNDFTLVGDANWRIQEDLLMADFLLSKTPSYLVTRSSHKNFQIRAEIWVDGQSNSGIFIRCADPAKIDSKVCYEINIWDSRPDPSYGTGAIVDVAKVSPMPRAGGQWNTLEITADGDHLVVFLNGQKTADAHDAQLTQGHIGLQYGSGIVKFRKVEIHEL
jgi:hypothetical protein